MVVVVLVVVDELPPMTVELSDDSDDGMEWQ
jgi:hypothetical protein